MREPVCECSDVYSRRHGMLVDEDDRKGPGPHEGCCCGVCFYGRRAAWLAGRQSVIDWLRSDEADALRADHNPHEAPDPARLADILDGLHDRDAAGT